MATPQDSNHDEALSVVEQLLGGILSLPPHLDAFLISKELEHRHRLLGLSPSGRGGSGSIDHVDRSQAVDYLFTDVYSFGPSASQEVMRGIEALGLQLERGGAMGSGVDPRTVVRAISTSVAYQSPESGVILVQIGLGRNEEVQEGGREGDRPLILVLLRSEGMLDPNRPDFKFDGLQPSSRPLPGSWFSTWQDALNATAAAPHGASRSGDDMDTDHHHHTHHRTSSRNIRGAQASQEQEGERNQGRQGELIDSAEDFWAGVDDEDEEKDDPLSDRGGDDEARRKEQEEAAEAAYWAAYDQVSGSPTAGADVGGEALPQTIPRGAATGADADLSLESVEEARKRKRSRPQTGVQDSSSSVPNPKRALQEEAVKEMLKGAFKLATSSDPTAFSEDDFARIAREAAWEVLSESSRTTGSSFVR